MSCKRKAIIDVVAPPVDNRFALDGYLGGALGVQFAAGSPGLLH